MRRVLDPLDLRRISCGRCTHLLETMARNSCLVLTVMAITGCGADSVRESQPKRYEHSYDLTEQVLMLSTNVGLIKTTKMDEREPNFSLVQAHWGGEPDFPSASGYLVDKWLAVGISRISVVGLEGMLLVDMGESPSYKRYALIEVKTAKAITGQTISTLGLSEANVSLKWLPITLYFDRELHNVIGKQQPKKSR